MNKEMRRRNLFCDDSVENVSRRSLFSEVHVSTRKKLFSDQFQIEESPEEVASNPEGEEVILVCQDCGHEVSVPKGSTTTHKVCMNCGGDRFNVKDAMSGRRKMFCSMTGGNDTGVATGKNLDEHNQFVCLDCGEEFTDQSDITQGVRCPNCGGNRVKKVEDPVIEEAGAQDDATDEILKKFSGKTVSRDELQKEFTEHGVTESVDDFVSSGYASVDNEGQICFSENASEIRKMFSEIVISVTKELHLVPAENKLESLIQNLEERGNIPERGIILIKKAHGFIPHGEPMITPFSESTDYIKDSGLSNDLKLEYSGKKMALKEFMDILNTQYNDAPDDILDELVNSGIVKISGSQVEIN